MRSYQQWKKLNESLYGAMPLGISSQQAVGGLRGALTQEDPMDEMKKKMMDGDPEKCCDKCGDENCSCEDGGGDDVSDKDESPEFMKKKMKKMGKKMSYMKKKMCSKMGKKMAEEIEQEADIFAESDDDEMTIEEAKLKKAMKKHMKKKMMDIDAETDEDETGDGEMVEPASEKDEPAGDDMENGDGSDDDDDDEMVSAEMKKKMKKKMKKESTEESDWWKSIHDMMSYDPNTVSWSGLSKVEEEALLAPLDPNEGLAANDESQPQPGDVGFAPDTRLGEL